MYVNCFLTLDVEKQKAVVSFFALSALMSVSCWYLFLFPLGLAPKLNGPSLSSSKPHPPQSMLALMPRNFPVAM